MKNRNRALALLLLTFVGALALGCDSAGPLAPRGTTLIVTASPSRIGINGTSEITIIGRKPDGNPLQRDTEIRLSSNIGVVPAIVLADGSGVAKATLRGDGRRGTATVTATTGTSTGTGTGSGSGSSSGGTAPAGSVIVEIGENAVLTLVASPTQVGLTGTSRITVIGRTSDGNPVEANTEIRLTTSLGSISPNLVRTDSSGQAVATLRGEGFAGDATVTATAASGSGAEGGGATATVSVRIGETSASKPTVIVSVNPSNVPVEGSAIVTVIGRNSDGSPLGSGQTVILTSSLGTFDNDRPVTGSDGTATATLSAGRTAGEATITAFIGSSDAATTRLTIRDAATDIGLSAASNAVDRGSSVDLTAIVNNAQGQEVQGATVRFSILRADTGVQGTLEPTVDLTDSQGEANAKLTINQNSAVGTITIQATTADGNGDQIPDTVVITVR